MRAGNRAMALISPQARGFRSEGFSDLERISETSIPAVIETIDDLWYVATHHLFVRSEAIGGKDDRVDADHILRAIRASGSGSQCAVELLDVS